MPPLLTSTAYFPPAQWFVLAGECGAWYTEAHENYQKGSWRNRCRIAGPNGVQLLSIPLEKGKHQKKPIQEVRISYRNEWWREHEQAIKTAYGRSPFFEYYAEELFAVARSRPATLWALNQELTEVVLRLLHWATPRLETETFISGENPAFQRVEQPAAGLMPYQQVFTDRHGFLPDLSVLDALFCLGPQLVTSQIAPQSPPPGSPA
jgi:hypothetical protein